MPPRNAESIPAATAPRHGPYRIMVVDDSAVVRGLITRALEQDPEIAIVASVADGRQAVNAAARLKLDVVVLDIEMPVMDGVAALPKLFEVDSSLKIIIASTLTKRNAYISLRALMAGASDYLAKPSTARGLSLAADFQRELLAKVKALAAARRGGQNHGAARAAPSPMESLQAPWRSALSVVRPATSAPIILRPPSSMRPELLAIASSTGGPQALMAVLGGLDDSVTLPILITQHMPPTFTAILAEHIARQCKRTCREASDGEAIESNRVYIAPGDHHMLVEARGATRVVRLDKGPFENFCRPAADPMLRSVAQTYGARALALVLTGMGHDGLNGAQAVAAAGGTILAQDAATSVVWGMPGAVAQAGLCSAILAKDEIAPYVRRHVLGCAP